MTRPKSAQTTPRAMFELLEPRLLLDAVLPGSQGDVEIVDTWVHAGKTSACVSWQLSDISTEGNSYVEYGLTDSYGMTTTETTDPRWTHIHWITALQTGQTYHYRMVTDVEGEDIYSADMTFATSYYTGAVEIGNTGGTRVLSSANTTYILTEDLTTSGTSIIINGSGITLEMDGHTVTYSQAAGQIYGLRVTASNVTVYNGHVVQGAQGGDYSHGLGGNGASNAIEVAGVGFDVHLKCANPLKLIGGSSGNVKIHHNHFYSTVDEVESRHYPGNDLVNVALETSTHLEIYNNLLTEGCHRGITLVGDRAASVDIHNNDIRHNEKFVNGYALTGQLDGGTVHYNKITSQGRGVHLSGEDIEFYDNWINTKGHMTLDDIPAGGPFLEHYIEQHGIKLEGSGVRNCSVHDNYVRIVQEQPDAEWDGYVPPTPLNIASYYGNAMNEVYDNVFIALTTYTSTWHGGYGNSGQWAAGVWCIAMNQGTSSPGMYSTWIHDNHITSNDVYIGSASGTIGTSNVVRIENNTFSLGENPTNAMTVFYNIPSTVRQRFIDGDNVWEGPVIPLPATIQAEDYNLDYDQVGYDDTTSGNSGNVYRSDDVDIQATSDAGGGYNVYNIAAGEWLEYTVEVPYTGVYNIMARVAATSSGRSFWIELDGDNRTGTVSVPLTGGSQTWTSVSAPAMMEAGRHQLRFATSTGGFNLNHLSIIPDDAMVMGRHVFYNNTSFDANDPGSNLQDDRAIASDKSALLPGGSASFANYTSFDRGITGIMVDVIGISGTPTAADFTFKVGNNADPDTWAVAPAPIVVALRPGEGQGGSDRLTVIWADNAIRNEWLQVTLLANEVTGFDDDDVFYFGNAVGDTGNSASDAFVNALDAGGIRDNNRGLLDPAPVDDVYDVNRDEVVDISDFFTVAMNGAGPLNSLQLISVPDVQGASAPEAPGSLETAEMPAPQPLASLAEPLSAAPVQALTPAVRSRPTLVMSLAGPVSVSADPVAAAPAVDYDYAVAPVELDVAPDEVVAAAPALSTGDVGAAAVPSLLARLDTPLEDILGGSLMQTPLR